MTSLKCLLLSACIVAFCTSCSRPAPVEKAEKKAAEESSAFRIYVTNEVSGDLTVIDSATYSVIATVPLGKRPRGIHASPDRKTIYVALSGSPIAGPDVDESTLPPPDKSADGIGVFDVAQNKVGRVIKSGSDPENFDVSKDGTQLFISNEDEEAVSVVDVASGTVVKSARSGRSRRESRSHRMESWSTSLQRKPARFPSSIRQPAKSSRRLRSGTDRARSRSCRMVQKLISMPRMTVPWSLWMR